jgi:hypothetical protein
MNINISKSRAITFSRKTNILLLKYKSGDSYIIILTLLRIWEFVVEHLEMLFVCVQPHPEKDPLTLHPRVSL